MLASVSDLNGPDAVLITVFICATVILVAAAGSWATVWCTKLICEAIRLRNALPANQEDEAPSKSPTEFSGGIDGTQLPASANEEGKIK